jgi:type IV pilus assembly protein PilQ
MKLKLTYLFLLTMLMSSLSYGQKYSEETLRATLDSISVKHVGYNNQVQLNVSSLDLSELINSIALENNLNISIDPRLNMPVSYNFFDAQVKDVLVFLYLNFQLEYDFVGSILSINKRETEKIERTVKTPYKVDVTYNPANQFLSMNLKNDTLFKVAEEITRLTGKNFVIDPAIRGEVVNAYLLNRPLEEVLDMFAKSNAIKLSNEEEYYQLMKGDFKSSTSNQLNTNESGNYRSKYNPGDFKIIRTPIGTLDIIARDVNLTDLIQAAADETGVHYVLYTNVTGKANLELKDVRFDELLSHVFRGSPYSAVNEKGIFLIGENKQGGLRTTNLIRLENRTIESVLEAIPNELLSGLDVKKFEELNGIIVTGAPDKIEILKEFIRTIDLVVPMVQIDVMLLYSQKGSQARTGMKAGFKDQPTQTNGEVFPELDVELGAESVNNILNAITGFGVVNLGQVSENFYISLQALESNSIISIESTPKISTLNGHEANISIGETTYYQETQVNVQTSVTNQGVLQSRQWKSIDANLAVTITPYVSADEHVTLTITVEQDDFSGKVDPSSPPNITTQTFQSMVRVKNGEMILLGGLEKKKKSDTGSGVPFLSRIPIIKWFFSSRAKDREKSKLHILIRPTVSY